MSNVIHTDRFGKPRSVYVIDGNADEVAKTICAGIERKRRSPPDDTPPGAA